MIQPAGVGRVDQPPVAGGRHLGDQIAAGQTGVQIPGRADGDRTGAQGGEWTQAEQPTGGLGELAERLEASSEIADLQALNQELEAFSFSVSHDLRAPLRRIDGFSRALMEDHDARLDEVEALYLEKLMATRDAREGLQAFVEKRRPKWEHR